MVLSGGGSMKGRVCHEGEGVLWRGQTAMKRVLYKRAGAVKEGAIKGDPMKGGP